MRHYNMPPEMYSAASEVGGLIQTNVQAMSFTDQLLFYDSLMTSIDELQMYDRDHPTLEDALGFLSKHLESIEPAFLETDQRHLLRAKILCTLGIFHGIPREMVSHRLLEGVLLFAVHHDNEFNAIKALQTYQILFHFPNFCISSELSTFIDDSIKMYAKVTAKVREGGILIEITQLELDIRQMKLTAIDKDVLKRLMDKYSRESELSIFNHPTSRVADNRVKFYPKAKQSFKVLAVLPTLYTNLFNYTEKNRERFNFVELCLTLLEFTRCSIDDDKRKASDKHTLSLLYIAQIKTLEFLAKAVKVFSTSQNKQEIGVKFADSYLNILTWTKLDLLPERKELLYSLKQMFDSEFAVHMIKLIPELCSEPNILGIRISEEEGLRVYGSEIVCDMFSQTIRYLDYELFSMVLHHCQIEIIDTKNGVATNIKYLDLTIELIQHAMTIQNDPKKPLRRLIFYVLECLVHKLALLVDYYIPLFKFNDYMALAKKHVDMRNKLPHQSPSNHFLRINMNALVPTRPQQEHAPLNRVYRDCRHSKLNSQMNPMEVKMLWVKIYEVVNSLLCSMKQANPVNGEDMIGNELEILEELLMRGYKCVEILKCSKVYQQLVRKNPENLNLIAEDKRLIDVYCTTFCLNMDPRTWIYLLKRNFSRMTGNAMICNDQCSIVLKLLDYPLFFEEYSNWFLIYIRENIKKLRDSTYDKCIYDRKIFQRIFSPHPALNTDTTFDVLSKVYTPHVVPIVKEILENIFKSSDCTFYLCLIEYMHKSPNQLVQQVLAQELKPLFTSIYLCLARLMTWERKSQRDVISDTTMSFSTTYIGDARFIPLWMIAVKLCLKPINAISCLNQCYTSIHEMTTNVDCSSLFDLGCQDVGSISETLHEWLIQIVAYPTETAKFRLENNKKIGRFGFAINNRYFDNYPLLTQINTSFNEPLLQISFPRNMQNFRYALRHAEKSRLLNNAKQLLEDITSTEQIVGTLPLGEALAIAMKVTSSWMNSKQSALTQKQRENYYSKTFVYIEDAFALCRKVILAALTPCHLKIPRQDDFQSKIGQALKRVKEKMDRNEIREIVKKNDVKVRGAMKSALFVVFASAHDKVGRSREYQVMEVLFQNQVLMAVLEQLDEQFSEGLYMDSSMLGETIANFVWHNGQSLGYELFKKAVMSVEAFLGAPAGYGYKLPLFSYTLKYIQQNALDINMLSRKGSMKFFSCVLKEAPYYFVHENFTVFFNLFTYVIRNDFYENYTQNCELARGGMIALFKKRENDCDRPVFGSPQTLNQLMEFIFSENQELSKCGVSVVSEMFCTLTGQPMQLLAQQMYQCMKAKIKPLTFSASTCTIDTYIGTLYGVTEVMNMTKVKCFFDSSIEEHFGPLVDLARQSLSRTENEIQEVWKSRTAASAFADTINDQFNYYPAVRLAETKFLVAVYECLAKKLEPAQLQIDQPAVIYIKELTSSFLRLMMNCNGILREKIAHELLKTRTVLSELGYDLSCLINVNEFRTSCNELFSDYQEFNLEALSKFVCITSIVNSEIVMSDLKSMFNKTIGLYVEDLNDMSTDQFRSIKKVVKIICDRQIIDVQFLKPLLILMRKLWTTYFIEEEFQFDKDIIPLVNAHPEQVVDFLCGSENIYDRYFYQLFRKLLCSTETTALKQYLKDNPIVFTQLLSQKAKSPDGNTWLDVKWDESHSREDWDLFVYGIILHTIIKEREWWGKQKEICDLIKEYFDSQQFDATYSIALHTNTTGKRTQMKKLDLPMYRVPEYMVKILLLYFIENVGDFDLLLTINKINDNQYLTDFTFYHIFLADEIYPKVEPVWRKKMIFYFFNELVSVQPSTLKLKSKLCCFLQYVINPCFEWYLSRFDGNDFVNEPLSETEPTNILSWVVNQISKFDNQKTFPPSLQNLLIGILQFLKIAARLHCVSFKPPGSVNNSDELKAAIRPVISLCFKLLRSKSTSGMKYDPIVRLYASHTIGYFAAEFEFAAGPAVQSFESLLELSYDEANDTDQKSIRGMVGAISSINAPDFNVLIVGQKIRNTIVADKNNLKPLIWMMRIVKINVDYFYVIRNQIFNHVISSFIKMPNVFEGNIPLQKEYLEFIEVIVRWEDIRKIRQHAFDTQVQIEPELDFSCNFVENLDAAMQNVYVNYGLNYLIRINAFTIGNRSRSENARNYCINECVYKKSALLISNLLTPKYYGDIFVLNKENFSTMYLLYKRCVEDSSNNIKPDVSLLCSYFQVLTEAIKVLPRQRIIDTVKMLQRLFVSICQNSHNIPISIVWTFFQTVLNVLKISKDGFTEVPELNNYLIKEFNTMGQCSSQNSKIPIKIAISLLRLYFQANADFLENKCLDNVIALIKHYTSHVLTNYAAVQTTNPHLEKDGSDFVEVLMEALSGRLVYYSTEKRDKVIKEILPLYTEQFPGHKILGFLLTMCLNLLKINVASKCIIAYLAAIAKNNELRIISNNDFLKTLIECIVLVQENPDIARCGDAKALYRFSTYNSFLLGKNTNWKLIALQDRNIQPDIVSRLVHLFGHQTFQSGRNLIPAMRLIWNLILFQGNTSVEDVTNKKRAGLQNGKSQRKHCASAAGTFANLPSFLNLLKKVCYFDTLSEGQLYKLPLNKGDLIRSEEEAMEVDDIGERLQVNNNLEEPMEVDDSEYVSMKKNETNEDSITIEALSRIYKLYDMASNTNIQVELCALFNLFHCNNDAFSNCLYKLIGSIWKCLHPSERALIESYMPRLFFANFIPQSNNINPEMQIKFLIQQKISPDIYFGTVFGSFLNRFMFPLLCHLDPIPYLPPDLVRFLSSEFGDQFGGLLMLEKQLDNLSDPLTPNFIKNPTLLQLEGPHLKQLQLMNNMSEMYTLMQEKDQVYSVWSHRAYHPETAKAILNFNHNEFANCISTCEQVLESYSHGKNSAYVTHLTVELKVEVNELKEMWLKSLKEMGEWGRIREYASHANINDPSLIVESSYFLQDWGVIKDLRKQKAVSITSENDEETNMFESIMLLMMCDSRSDRTSNLKQDLKKKMDENMRETANVYKRYPKLFTDAHILKLQYVPILVEMAETLEWSVMDDVSQMNEEVISEVVCKFESLMNVWASRFQVPALLYNTSSVEMYFNWRKCILSNVLNSFQKNCRPPSDQNNMLFANICPLIKSTISTLTTNFVKFLTKNRQYDRGMEELEHVKQQKVSDWSGKINANLLLLKTCNKKAKFWKTTAEDKQKCLNTIFVITNNLDYKLVNKTQPQSVGLFFQERAIALGRSGHLEESENLFCQAVTTVGTTCSSGKDTWRKFANMFEEQMDQGVLVTPKLFKSALLATLESLRYADLWKNNKNIANLIFYLKKATILGGEYQQLADQILIQKGPDIPLLTWTHYLNDLVLELSLRPNKGIKMILSNFARQFPQRIFYALRTYLSNDMIQILIAHKNTFSINDSFKPALHEPTEVLERSGEGRGILDLKDVLAAAIQVKAATISQLFKLCKDIDEQLDFKTDSIVRGANQIIECIFKSAERGLNQNIDDAWIPSTTSNLTEWKQDVVNVLNGETSLSKTTSNALKEKSAAIFVDRTNGSVRDVVDQIVEFINVLTVAMFNGSKAGFGHFDPGKSVASYTARQCSLDVFTYGMYGIHQSGEREIQDYYCYTIAHIIPCFKYIYRNGVIMKEIVVRGNNGKNYVYIYEKHKDIPMRNRVNIFYKFLNNMMTKESGSRARHLQFAECRYIPISENGCLFDYSLLGEIGSELMAYRLFTLYDTMDQSYEDKGNCHQTAAVFIDRAKAIAPLTTEKSAKIVEEMVDGSGSNESVVNTNMLTKWMKQKYTEPNTYYIARRRFSRKLAMVGMSGHILHMQPSTLKNTTFDVMNMNLFTTNYQMDYHAKCLKYESTLGNHIRLTSNIETFIHHTVEGHYLNAVIAFTRCFANRSMKSHIRLLLLDQLLLQDGREDPTTLDCLDATLNNLGDYFKTHSILDDDKCLLWDVIKNATSYTRRSHIPITDFPWF